MPKVSQSIFVEHIIIGRKRLIHMKHIHDNDYFTFHVHFFKPNIRILSLGLSSEPNTQKLRCCGNIVAVSLTTKWTHSVFCVKPWTCYEIDLARTAKTTNWLIDCCDDV